MFADLKKLDKEHKEKQKWLEEQKKEAIKDYANQVKKDKQRKALWNLGSALTTYGNNTLNNSKKYLFKQSKN